MLINLQKVTFKDHIEQHHRIKPSLEVFMKPIFCFIRFIHRFAVTCVDSAFTYVKRE